jgi:hypothetical protein
VRVTTHYVQVGDGAVVEFVTTYGGSETMDITVNVLPAEPAPGDTPHPDAMQLGQAPTETAPLAASVEPLEPVSAPSVLAAAPAPTKKRRALMGVIRATKTLAFTVGGEALVYVTNNLAGLNLPPGLGLAVGAAAYGVNKAIKPDGLL